MKIACICCPHKQETEMNNLDFLIMDNGKNGKVEAKQPH